MNSRSVVNHAILGQEMVSMGLLEGKPLEQSNWNHSCDVFMSGVVVNAESLDLHVQICGSKQCVGLKRFYLSQWCQHIVQVYM